MITIREFLDIWSYSEEDKIEILSNYLGMPFAEWTCNYVSLLPVKYLDVEILSLGYVEIDNDHKCINVSIDCDKDRKYIKKDTSEITLLDFLDTWSINYHAIIKNYTFGKHIWNNIIVKQDGDSIYDGNMMDVTYRILHSRIRDIELDKTNGTVIIILYGKGDICD